MGKCVELNHPTIPAIVWLAYPNNVNSLSQRSPRSLMVFIDSNKRGRKNPGIIYCGFKFRETKANTAVRNNSKKMFSEMTCSRHHMITAQSSQFVLIVALCWAEHNDFIQMLWLEEKKMQSSVIVPGNEIDSHPTEHEITLADDTAVTLPETLYKSNRNNQHFLAWLRHT